jgi:hypothetical protein
MKCWLGTQGIEVGGRRWNRLALIMMISLGMDRDRDNLDGWMRNDIRDIILGDEFESACLISYFLRSNEEEGTSSSWNVGVGGLV